MYIALVCPDADGGIRISSEERSIIFCCREKEIEVAIREVSRQFPHNTICVYRLTEMQRVKEQPVYARYNVTSTGEILPV